MAIQIARTVNGKAYAHFWRDAPVYESFHSERFLAEWTTIKHVVLPYHRHGPVYHRDCRQPFDVPDNTFDAVYVFHVLEHLTRKEAQRFIAELSRIMKLGALLRISSPDLAAFARVYLACLEKVAADSSEPNLMNYEWASAHLIDQMVRDTSGGRMKELLEAGRWDPAFMKREFGDALVGFLERREAPPSTKSRRSFSFLYWGVIRRLRRWALGTHPQTIGESDKWAYDRFSLQRLVEHQGFSDFRVMDYCDSQIDAWDRFRFDASRFGPYPHEPSLYSECRLD